MAHAVQVALALTEKVARLEARRRDVSVLDAGFWAGTLATIAGLVEEVQGLKEEDGRAYQEFMEAREPGKSASERRAALARAVEVPLRIMGKAREGLECAAQAGERCRAHLRPDCHAACELLRGACLGARAIARANLAMLSAMPQP